MRTVSKAVIVSASIIVAILLVTSWAGILPIAQLFQNTQSTSIDDSQYLLKQVYDVPVNLGYGTPVSYLNKPISNVTSALVRTVQITIEGDATEWNNSTEIRLLLSITRYSGEPNNPMTSKVVKKGDRLFLYLETALSVKCSSTFYSEIQIWNPSVQASFKGTFRIAVVQTITKP